MTAPAATHDLRCKHLTSPDPSVPCTCRRGADDVLLPPGTRVCARCGCAPQWQVGPDYRACDDDLIPVLRHFYSHGYDGFLPCVVAPLSARGGAS